MRKKNSVNSKDFRNIIEILEKLSEIASPSGFTKEIITHVQELLETNSIKTRLTNKGGLIAGNHPKPRTIVSGHVDTLGAMVSQINSDGTLSITKIGGLLLPTFEGSYVSVALENGQKIRGTLLLKNPSAHVNLEAGTKERKVEGMHIRLDKEVRSKQDTEKLEVQIGDFVLFDSRFEYTESGYVKSHFLDDKAGVACMIAAILELGEKKMAKIPASFFFSNYEEVGHGASGGLPEGAEEMIVVDMGVVGTDVAGEEQAVSICVKDSSGPYDFETRLKLVRLARENEIPHKLDVFPFYGSDGSAALRAGYSLRVGLIGPGISASHGMERTHQTGLVATKNLLKAYLESFL
ncbi:MAG: M42 family metallopeptidase [Candidatus Riflebacteria bacterium]|nr:M42 family metallopeptidase [Candidatus Riflebacteria bacterium]